MQTFTMEAVLRILDSVGTLFSEHVRRRMVERNYNRNIFILRNILPYIRQRKISSILDVGIGPGVISLVLRKVGFQVIGIDTWNEYLPEYNNISGTKEDILRRLKESDVELLFCDVERGGIPFQDESFDMVLLLDVIEHLQGSPKRTLEEIRRVLKTAGLLIISSPNVSNLKNRIIFLLGNSINPTFNNFKAWFLQNDLNYFGHQREYNSQEIRFMCEYLRFEVENIEFSNCFQIPTPIKGTNYYVRDFKFHSINQCIKAIYLMITKIFKTLRYYIIFIAKKRE